MEGQTVFKSLVLDSDDDSAAGAWDGLSIQAPYEVSQPFEQKRAEAQASSDTLYVYDWPVLFESEARKRWESHVKLSPRAAVDTRDGDDTFKVEELVLCDPGSKLPLAKGWTARDAELNSILLPISRDAGLNDVGMVAWLISMKTPECPAGRQIVIICNDITFQAGSFGTREDILFFKVG